MYKILIIDDDELIRLTLKNALKKMPSEVIEATNGQEGVDLFKKERPDLVITDILMPEKEGLQTISEILAEDSNTKIIAMSSGGSGNNLSFLQLAKTLGAHCAIRKPVKPFELLNAVQRLLTN